MTPATLEHDEGRARRDKLAQPPVLIVDDDPVCSTFVAEVVARAGYPIQRVSTGAEAVEFARRQRPAAVVLDVVLPGASGLEICHELRQEHGEELPIVFVSGERTEPADRIAGLLVGGDDYIVKPFDLDELMARVRRLIEKSAAMRRPSSRPGIGDLTSREIEVLRLLAEGLDQRAIAGKLFISPTTVATHIQRILTKLDVRSRTQAVALAYRERLLEPA